MKRRLLCALLALLLCVGLLPMTALAASDEPALAAELAEEPVEEAVEETEVPAASEEPAAEAVALANVEAEASALDGTGETEYTVLALADGPEDYGTVAVKNAAGEACSQFRAGDIVQIEATPANGYRVVSIRAQMESGQPMVEVGSSFTLTDSMPSSELTVWVTFAAENTAKITFHVKTGDGEAYTFWQTEEVGKDFVLPTNASTGKNAMVTGFTIGDKTYVPGTVVQFTEDTDVYAVYSEETGVELAFNVEGGFVSVYVAVGAEVEMENFGYEDILGWSGNYNGSLDYELGKAYRFYEDKMFFPVSEGGGNIDEGDEYDPYVINIDVNCSEIEIESGYLTKIEYNAQIATETEMLEDLNLALEEQELIRTDYTLLGWSLDAAGTQLWDGATLPENGATLYAIWAQDMVLTDEDTGVSVTIPGTAEDTESLTLVAELLDDTEEKAVNDVLVAKVSGETEKTYVLDIHFVNEDGEEVPVDSLRKVTIPIPEGWDAKNVAVYYVDTETGAVTNMNGVISADGQRITFVTDHFSYYALVQTAAKQSDTTPAAPAKPGKNAPKTGDESHLVLWAVVLLAACGSAAVVVKKKKEN